MAPRKPLPPSGPAPGPEHPEPTSIDRRTLLRLGGLAGGAALAGGWQSAAHAAERDGAEPVSGEPVKAPPTDVEEASIAHLQAAMAAGSLRAIDLVNQYLTRIALLDDGPNGVNSVIELNPRAQAIAHQLDRERRTSGPRGPLHGIPVMLKDNIDTGDLMQTTAGSLGMVGEPAPQDSTVAARLRAAGAIILGKTNLSEWANFRGFSSTSGWSGRGGLTRNPYSLDRNPCGSSSGSAASAASSFCAAGLGTETDGSIVCPGNNNGVVAIKPTVGLTSRAGVIPISHNQDTVGPHGRTVADAAAVLGALVGVDPRDPATAASAGKFHTDYTQFLDLDGLHGARIGVFRDTVTGYSRATDRLFEEALLAMADAGAVLVDPADVPTAQEILSDQSEITVLIYDFKRDLNAYLATRTGLAVHTLADLIAFNSAHASTELQYFGQELFELAEQDVFTTDDYTAALARSHSLSRELGIDKVLADNNLDALVAPTGSPAWSNDLVNGDHFLGASSSPCAMAGYPIINVPMGSAFGLPVGMSFMAAAFSEPTLIKLASGFEHVVQGRTPPRYLRFFKPGSADADRLAESPRPSRDLRGALDRALLERRRPFWL